MKSHNKFASAFVFVLLLVLLLSACGAERPENSVNLRCWNGGTAVYFEVGVTSGSVAFWYQNDLKAYISETELPSDIEDVGYSIRNMYFADVNADGYEDFVIPYSVKEENVYSFVLVNNGDNTFSVYEPLSDKPNISVSQQRIVSSEKIGDFGVRNFVYVIEENGVLSMENSYIEDTTKVIRAVVNDYYGVSGYKVEHPLRNTRIGIRYGRVMVGEEYCTAYTVTDGGEIVAVIAIDDEARWYIDEGGISLYKPLEISYDGVRIADGDYLVSSGVPYGLMDVASYKALQDAEKTVVCNAMSRFINDNGYKVASTGHESAVDSFIADGVDESANLFDIFCSLCDISSGIFLDW